MSSVALPTPSLSPTHDTRVIGLLTVAHGFSHFYQILLPSLFVFIAEDLKLSYTQLGIVLTFFFFASGFGQIASGFAVDRFGGRRLLLMGLALISGAHAAAGLAASFPWLIGCAFLAGAGNSVFHPADFSLLNRLVSSPRLPWAFSLHGIGGNIGYVLSPVFALAAGAAFGWHNALFLAGGLGLALAAFLYFEPTIRSAAPTKKIPAAQISAVADPLALVRPLMQPVIFVAFLFFCVATVYSTAISSFGTAIFRDYHGLEKAPAALLLTVYMVAQTVGMIGGGWIAASGRSPGNTAAIATLFACIVACGLWISPLSFAGLAALLIVIGASNGIVGPSRDLLVKKVAPKEALGRAYGVVYSGFDVGASVVPIIYGALIDRKLAGVVIGCIVGGFLVNASIARWLDRHLAVKA